MSVSRKDFSTLLFKGYKCGSQLHGIYVRKVNFHFIFSLSTWSHSCPQLYKSPLQLLSLVSLEKSQWPRCKIEEKIWLSKWSLYRISIHLPIFGATLHSNLQRYMVPSSPDALWASAEYGSLHLIGFPLWKNRFQLSPADNSVITHPFIFYPPKCCCVCSSLCPGGLGLFFDPLLLFYWDFGKRQN